MENTFATIEKYILYALVFLFPFFVLNTSPNPFVVPKMTLLAGGISLLLIIKAARTIATGKLEISVGRFDIPAFLIAASYLASGLLRTPNRMEAFLLPGTVTIVVGAALLYFFVNQLKGAEKKVLGMLLFFSGAVFSVLTLLAFTGALAKIPQLPPIVRAQFFTPEGGFLPATIFLATLLPIGIGVFLTEKNASKKILTGVAGLVVLLGLGVSVFNLLPGRQFAPQFPSYANGWSIAVDTMKESPLLGVGPGNYLTAFNRFRPLAYNQTDLWAVKFSTAKSFYLTLLTEAGLLGIAAFGLVALIVYRDTRKDMKEKKLVGWSLSISPNLLSLVLLMVLFLFFPATPLSLVLLFLYMSFITKSHRTTLNLQTQASTDSAQGQVASKIPALLIGLPVIAVAGWFLFRGYGVIKAEYHFNQGLQRLAQNDAQGTYEQIVESIRLNPGVDRYHSTFSRVNLALANSTVQNVQENITDQDRIQIAQLIQQAIEEGKAAVALNTLRAGNWEVLARTYQSIIPFAQGADAFAVTTFRQAVALDQINPNLRIGLGGIYYTTGDFRNAVQVFESAVFAKPDLANSHFNLAFALSESGDIERAITEMSTAMSLVDRGSEDYETARQALETLQEKAQLLTQEPTQNLTPPQPAEEPVLEPPLELPEQAEPPEAPITPTPEETEEGEEEGEGEEATVTPGLTPTPTP